MKALIAALAVLALAGCATTATSTAYRSAGQVDAWQIGGSFDGVNGITITINGNKVIEESMGMFSGIGSREFTGTYQGKPILAECEYKRQFYAAGYMQCQVFVSNERAANLRF